MTAIDNSELVAPFLDETYDNDTFWYTELLDRSKNGSSRFKILRSFEHNDRAQLLEQMPTIRQLCDRNNARAYIRLSPRSRKQVAKHMLTQVVEQVLEEHYDALYHAYNSSKGKSCIHERKLWLFDVDGIGHATLADRLRELGRIRAIIPSRNGYHIITSGFDLRELGGPIAMAVLGHEVLHRDNPTNLYIPEGAV